MRVSEALNKAADRIESHGWWDGGSGSACQLGAGCASNQIKRATGVTGHPAQRAFSQYLGGFGAPSTIFDWNDFPGRTAEQVIEALRACALIEAARESQVAAELTYAENLAAAGVAS